MKRYVEWTLKLQFKKGRNSKTINGHVLDIKELKEDGKNILEIEYIPRINLDDDCRRILSKRNK